MSSYRYSVDRRFFYQQPKPRFGEILNANQVTPRDINKDLMVKTQKTSDIKNLSKSYPNKSYQGYYQRYGRRI